MDLLAKLNQSSLDPALIAQVTSALNTAAKATAEAAHLARSGRIVDTTYF